MGDGKGFGCHGDMVCERMTTTSDGYLSESTFRLRKCEYLQQNLNPTDASLI